MRRNSISSLNRPFILSIPFCYLSVILCFSLLGFQIGRTQRREFHSKDEPERSIQNSTSAFVYPLCRTSTVPYVSRMLETAQYLLFHSTTSFVRFGDGEVLLMNGTNTSFETFSAELRDGLLRSLHEDSPNFMIGLPPIFNPASTGWWAHNDKFRQFFLKHVKLNKQYLSAFLSHGTTRDRACELVPQTYETLRNIWRNKSLVILRGNNTQHYVHDVFDTASEQKILYAPRYRAWSDYPHLKQQLLQQDPNSLYILAAGPVSKVLVYDLYKSGRRALDVGHLAKAYDAYSGNKQWLGSFFKD